MKKIIYFVFLFLFFCFDSKTLVDAKTDADRYLLKNNAAVRISVETGWQRDGMTPVQLDIQGLNLTLWMDGEGRVFDDFLPGFEKSGEKRALRKELFHLDKASGKIQNGDHTLNGKVYEQNGLRTRLLMENLPLALELNIQKGRAVLDLNGIVIPASLNLGQESNGLRELEIGGRGNPGRGHLLLDAPHGQLFWQDNRAMPGLEKQRSGRICWAQKQK